MQNAGWLVGWILRILAVLYLGFGSIRRLTPAVRMVQGWARANMHVISGVGYLVSVVVLLITFWGQAQPLWVSLQGFAHSLTIRRRPATDGDRGRER